MENAACQVQPELMNFDAMHTVTTLMVYARGSKMVLTINVPHRAAEN